MMTRSRYISILVIAVAMAFSQCLFNNLIGDSQTIFLENSFYRNPANISKLFSSGFIMDPSRMDAAAVGETELSGFISYRPVTALSFFLDEFLWHGKAAGYHLTNILIHLGCVILLFVLSCRLTGRTVTSFFVAFLFAVHPIQSEVVNNVGYRSDLLCGLFFILSFLCYIRWTDPKRKEGAGAPLGCLVGFAAALFSKETALMLPAVIVIYDLIYARHEDLYRKAKNYLGLFAVFLFFIVIYFLVFPSGFYPKYINRAISEWTHGLLVLKIFYQYLVGFLLPHTVHILPPLYAPKVSAIPVTHIIVSIGSLTSMIFLIVRCWKNCRAVSFGLCWFLLTYLPASNLMPLPNSYAWRFCYLPSAGFFFALVTLIVYAAGQTRFDLTKAGSAVTVCLSIYLILLTMAMNTHFRNNISACREMIRHYPDSSRPYWILGLEFLSQKDYPLAEKYFLHYLQTDPDNPFISDIRSDYLAYLMLGRSVMYDTDRAKEYFDKAVSLNPQFFPGWLDAARVLILQGRFDDALPYARQAAALRPDNILGSIYQIHALSELNRLNEAAAILTGIKAVFPGNPDLIWVEQFYLQKRQMNET